MSVNFPNTNDKEYLRLLDLANGNSMLVYSVWTATNGNVDNISSLEELKSILKEYLIKKTKESSTTYIPNEELVKKNPVFNFSYEQREEIKNSLLYMASIDSKTNTLLDIDEIGKNLNEKFFKEKLEQLSKSPIYSKYKDNYNKLLEPRTLREFVHQVREDFKGLDTRIELTEDSELSEDDKSTNEYIKDATLIDFKDKASASAKLLVRFIPKEGSGDTLGLKQFSNFDKNWNTLQELFSNITERGEGRFQQMLEELDKILPYKPYLYYLKKHLTDLESDGKHSPKVTQFMRAFDKTRITYTSSFIEQDGNFYLNKIGDSNQKSKERIILYNWQNNFNNLYFSEDSFGNIIFNKNKAQKALNNYNKLLKIFARLESINENSLNDVKILLEEMGIIVDEITLDKIVYKPITDTQKEGLSEEEIEKLHHETSLNNFKAFVSDLDKLFLGARRAYTNSLTHLINKKDFGNSNNKKRLLTPINDTQSFLLPLAKEQTFFEEDLYNSTFYFGNKMYYEYSLYNDIELKVQDYNLGEDSKELQAANRDLYTANSTWREALNNGAKIKLELFIARKLKGNYHYFTKELSAVDELADRVDRLNIGQLPYITLRDKNRINYISGMPIIKSQNINIDDYVADIFTGYFFDELITMQKAWEDLYGENPIPKEEQIEYYHTRGNVFQSTIFPSLSFGSPLIAELESKGINIYQKYDKVGKPFTLHPTVLNTDDVTGNLEIKESLTEALRPYIKDILKSKIESNRERFRELFGEKNSSALSKTTLNSLGAYKNGKIDIEASLDNISTYFTINTLSANIEITKLFTGDPRMFKNIPDFLKRTPATSDTGEHLRIGGNVRPYYGISVVKSLIKPSTLYKDKDSIKEIINFEGDEQLVADVLNLEKNSKGEWESTGNNPYGEINSADAQAWITIDRFKEIVSGLEGWSNELETAFNNIKNDTASKEDFNVFMNKSKNLFMQPKKGMHYELKEINGVRVPVYLKYSQAILFPQLTKNSPELSRMLNLMEKSDIDELITFDGIKVGASGVTDLNDPNLEKLNRIELSNTNWKLQQDLPSSVAASVHAGGVK